MNILEAMLSPSVFGAWFKKPSWNAWEAFLVGLFALPMDDANLALFRQHTGRTTPPTAPAREGRLGCGRPTRR